MFLRLWLVRNNDRVCICVASNRERAKKISKNHLKEDPDKYIVTPLTEKSDHVKMYLLFGEIKFAN